MVIYSPFFRTLQCMWPGGREIKEQTREEMRRVPLMRQNCRLCKFVALMFDKTSRRRPGGSNGQSPDGDCSARALGHEDRPTVSMRTPAARPRPPLCEDCSTRLAFPDAVPLESVRVPLHRYEDVRSMGEPLRRDMSKGSPKTNVGQCHGRRGNALAAGESRRNPSAKSFDTRRHNYLSRTTRRNIVTRVRRR